MSFYIDKIRRELFSAQITVVSVFDNKGLDLLDQALTEANTGRILVLYDPCLIAVARALAGNQPPSIGLAAWKKQASSALSVYRLNSHRIVFASAAAIEAAPQQFQTSLSQHFKLSRDLETITAPAAPDWNAWHLVLASQALMRDSEALLLDHELEAAALPLQPILGDADEAFAEFSAAVAIRELLSQQLANVQSELREHLSSAAAQANTTTLAEITGISTNAGVMWEDAAGKTTERTVEALLRQGDPDQPVEIVWPLSIGFGSWEGPYPQWNMPNPVRWIISRHATLMIESAVPGDFLLTFRYRCFVAEQGTEISVNGDIVGRLEISSDYDEFCNASIKISLVSGINKVLARFFESKNEDTSSARELVLLIEDVFLELLAEDIK